MSTPDFIMINGRHFNQETLAYELGRAFIEMQERAERAETRLGEIAATVDAWHGSNGDLWRALRAVLDGGA